MLLTRPGVMLGNRYLLHQRIGTGGMGEVWRAEDTMLRRPVALKVLHPALSDDESFSRRFVEEARTVAALRARGVVEIYDIRTERGEHGEFMTYLVMQLLEGRSLHELIGRQAPMPARRVLPLIAQVADALDAAHRAGIVHRDIKPANIMVDAQGAPTILDFGIALRRDQTALTATGIVLGTVGYASPEQLRGEELTGASDLYSLGVIAYECLSGAIPFDRNSPAAVIAGHLHEAPPPLPAKVPSVAAELVDWAMAKDPADRPATAGMFAQECRVAAPHAAERPRPAAAEPNRTTVDLLVSSSPPLRPTAPMPPAATDEPPRKRRGKGVLIGLAAVIAAVALTIGVMRYFDDSDDPGGQSAGEDPTPAPSSSESSAEATEAATTPAETAEPELPESSVLVSALSGACLIGYFDTPPPSARMDLCDDDGVDEFAFADPGDGVRLEYSYEDTSGGTAVMCIVWDGANLNFSEACDGPTWEFTYVRTDAAEDAADFWKIRASGGGNYCLDVPEEPNLEATEYRDAATAPVLSPCTEGDPGQEWRTTAA